MSKVKIQGNASGTGIFTVAAPATNTDRTITLPDVDATILTTAGGTISGVTQINNPTETGFASNLAETVSKATLKIKTHSTDSTLTTFGAISGGDAYIQRSNGSGTTEYNLRLNPFGGVVLKPNQPAFQAYRDAGHVSNNQVIVFNGVRFNIGSCYSNSTGRFTAPVAGRYQFNTHTMLVNGTGGDHQISFRVNGGNHSTLNPGNGTFNVAFGLSEVINLAAGDYVDVYYYDSQSNSIYGSGGANWTGFSGHLIG